MSLPKTHARQLGGRPWCPSRSPNLHMTSGPPSCIACQRGLASLGLGVGAPMRRPICSRAPDVSPGYLAAVRILNDWAARRAVG